MSVDFRSKSHRIPSQGIAESTLSGRRFAGMITGGAVALALILATAIPAKAERNEDLAKALIAALAIGALAHELREDDDRDRESGRQPRLPWACAISIEGAKRSVTFISENCLRREGFDRRLPRDCASSAAVLGKRDRVYSAQCLRAAGYRIADR
jgi:hypothetical protein